MKIGVAGITGRVSSLIIQEISTGKWADVTIGAGLSRTCNEQDEKDYHFPIFSPENLDQFLENCDCVIDFTSPESTIRIAEMASAKRKAMIVGTTGLSKARESELKSFSQKMPVVYAANMSLGVNLLLALAQKAASSLGPEWDIEILETHHKFKKDAPSGTALALGHAVAEGRGVNLESAGVFERYGDTGERDDGKIGFAVQRGGDVVGEHDVTFFGEGERICLSHVATDRSLFARGAVKAAQWAVNQQPGLYSMRDVLGL